MPDHYEIARRFKAARAATGLSQSEAARKLGIHPSRLSEYERGVNQISIVRMYEFIKVLDLDLAVLFPEWFGEQRD